MPHLYTFAPVSGGGGGASYYQYMQDEASPLPQRSSLNFIGSAILVSDDSGSNRTNITLADNLNAIASLSSSGFIVLDGSGSANTRSITGSNGISVSHGDGTSGNPTIALDINGLTSGTISTADSIPIYSSAATANRKVTFSDLLGLAYNQTIQEDGVSVTQRSIVNFIGTGLTANDDSLNARTNVTLASSLQGISAINTTGIVVHNGSNTFSTVEITSSAVELTVTDGDGIGGNPTIGLAGNLASFSSLSTSGLVARDSDGLYVTRSIVAPAAGITVTNGNGVSGSPTLGLANDLAAVEGLAGTGFAVRTGTDTWTNRSIAVSGSGISISNGSGVSGNPTISLSGLALAFAELSTNGLILKTGTTTVSTVAVPAGDAVVSSNGTTFVTKAPTAANQLYVSTAANAASWVTPRQFLEFTLNTTSSTVWNNSVTYTEITELRSTLPGSSGGWWFEAYFFYDSGTTPDFKVGVSGSAASSGYWNYEPATAGSTSVEITNTEPPATSVRLNGTGIGVLMCAKVSGYVENVTPTRTIKFWAAQMTANASNTTLQYAHVRWRSRTITNAYGG